ncbi:MAG: SPOR domain-containing protein [Oscillospiraceae bacterium]|nr:SPOR domain-containing protein [Oscillospiraceae bacterium]
MRESMRSVLALLLAVLMLGTLAATAFAEEPEYTYTDGQYYEADETLETYFTVQVSANKDLKSAERTRKAMLNAGFDSFVYQVDGMYRTMCGKFKHKEDAIRYRDLIREVAERKEAYVTEAQLPEFALEDFLTNLKEDPLVVGDVNFNGWETPTGPFLDMTDNEEETRPVYVVEYSNGTNFDSAQERRDELIEFGYDAQVVKLWGCYIVITGAFENRDEAKALRGEIRSATGHWSADVRQIELPVSALG